MSELVGIGVDFPCPGCGLTVTASSETDPPVLLHPMPMCERFIRVETIDDGVDYMREARQKSHPESFD